MLSLLRHKITYAFTLLALVGQLVFANGVLMVPKAHAQEMPMAQMSQNMDCHQAKPVVQSDDCCSKQVQSPETTVSTQQHCCGGSNMCQSDCNHCLFISIAGTLFEFSHWSAFQVPEKAQANVMPHFHSISQQQDIRPPIV
ncbi:hypothetical protein [Shewanella maritima]|uniref:hypothetical protein n=1 Tax=Shewanella maritima TaxID=2520507 RepID=UPI003736F577